MKIYSDTATSFKASDTYDACFPAGLLAF